MMDLSTRPRSFWRAFLFFDSQTLTRARSPVSLACHNHHGHRCLVQTSRGLQRRAALPVSATSRHSCTAQRLGCVCQCLSTCVCYLQQCLRENLVSTAHAHSCEPLTRIVQLWLQDMVSSCNSWAGLLQARCYRCF